MDRPVILIGHGIRAAGLEDRAHEIIEIGIPVLSSWQAADLVDNHHRLYFGRPGLWGQRCANHVLANADTVIAVGNRCSLWNVGYNGLEAKRLLMVDCDPNEAERLKAEVIEENIEYWLNRVQREPRTKCHAWVDQCMKWKLAFPWVEPGTHDDSGFIHPWRFTKALEQFFRHDVTIVTDMGTALVAAHQVLELRPPQRLMTSGGLGEMGCALPAAVGASFARDKGEVLCLHCDGGMMMNLQELQTIVHHKLPIKIIVYDNQGYSMIRQTQKTAGYPYAGVDKATGVSTPDFRLIAQSFGIASCDVKTWADFDKAIPNLFLSKEPGLVVYHMDPECDLVPKLLPIRHPDGRIESPPFWKMSP